MTDLIPDWVIHYSQALYFPSRCSCLLFVLLTNILSLCPPLLSVIPTNYCVCSSGLLLNNILFLFVPVCLPPSSSTLTHPSPPLVRPSAPQKHILIFCFQPVSLVVISYFSVQNCCLIWPPFLLTFGQHLLFRKPFSLIKQYTRFSNFKVVQTRMLCPYQFQGGSSPVFCDVHNAKWNIK